MFQKHGQYVLNKTHLTAVEHIESSTKDITSNKHNLNLSFTVIIVTQFIVKDQMQRFFIC